jgi:hypothetical protein
VYLRSVTKEGALKAFNEWLHPEHKRRMLVVEVIGNGETDSAYGRPSVEPEELGDYAHDQILRARSACKGQSWGKINAKLF